MEQKQVWDKIAEKWNSFISRPIPEAVDFLENKTGNILDLGCGSGRNFIKKKDVKLYGVDFSSELLKFAKNRIEKLGIDAELKKSDATKIPYGDDFFDSAIFVRVLHCIDSEEKREKSLRELLRVLKPDAEAVISVWSRGQDRIKNKDKECSVSWTAGNKKYFRYTYIYDENEITLLLKKIGFEIISSENGKSIVVVVRKPAE